MYPEVQDKAYEEINRVIGSDRFPTLQDFAKLPYMEALWKETLRWSPPFPTSRFPVRYFPVTNILLY